MKSSRWLASAAVALSCAACGSTVTLTGQLGGADSAGLGGTQASAAGGQSGPAQTASSGQVPASQGLVDTTSTTVGGSGTTDSASSFSTAAGPSEVLQAKTPITIGFQWLDTSSGTGGIDPSGKIQLGDQVSQAKATVAWMNAHGGIAGHKVNLYTASINYLNLFTNGAAEYEKACTAFKEDGHARFVSLFTNHPDLISCLTKKGIPSLSEVYAVGQKSYGTSPPSYYSPGQPSFEIGDNTAMNGFVDRGFLKGAKVGIFYDENPDFAPVLTGVEATLKSRGIPVAATFGSSLSSAQQGAQDASSAVLRFRAAGVTHVVVIDLGGGLTYLFMNSAKSQNYRPRYALTSANNAAALKELGPPDQLANAVVLGWVPGEATSEQPRAAKGWNSTGQLCYRILTKAGIDLSNASTAVSAIDVCDQLMAIKAIGDRATAISPQGFSAGADSLGVSFQSAAAFSTRFGKGRHYGAVGTRYLKWGGACACWIVDGSGPNL